MAYTSFLWFLVFFLGTYLFYLIIPKQYKWIVLLLSSWAFYAVSVKGHVLPIVLVTLGIWGIGLLLQKKNDQCKAAVKGKKREEKKAIKKRFTQQKSWITAGGVLFCLAFILVLKYGNFFGETFCSLFHIEFTKIHFLQPLGISFYTMQAISYIVDVNRGRVKACKNPLKLSLFLSFMFTVVEGPIARYSEMESELFEPKKLNQKHFYYGTMIVLWGLLKTVVISNRVSLIANNFFDNYTKRGGIGVLIGIMAYTLQLYCDFSGVMDVLRGCCYMMGIELPKNFNQPFFARTINEFWQRWHMTLGSFLRDYVFYPISFSKPMKSMSAGARKKLNTYYAAIVPTSVALFFVWFSNGLWHGSGIKYIVYGLYYYVLMMFGVYFEPFFAKLCKAIKINRKSKPYQLFQIARTFVIVNFGMLIFRADDLKAALHMLASVADNNQTIFLLRHPLKGIYGDMSPGFSIKEVTIIGIGILVILTVSLLIERGKKPLERIYQMQPVWRFAFYMLVLLVLVIFGAYSENYDTNQMIYAGF